MSGYSNDWVGQTLSDGRYRVDAKLGEGGMGFVYKVWDRNLDTDVVVKAPRKSMLDDPEFASRFALEIRSLVKLSHPNIVKVSDVGEHDRVPFAVMQYLAGGTLDERLDYDKGGRPLPASPASVSGWLPGMAAALDFIHGKGYIHRDVKPANILFDAHNHPYLSDFGVAKVLSDVEAVGAKKGPSGMTGIGIVLGTPEYMAPELIMGNTFDGKVDQYALAATAYEILCGRKPFTGETSMAILVRQTNDAPPPMVELPSAVAPAVSKVIFKGMAKKPGDRFITCAGFASALVDELAKATAARQSSAGRLACPSCGVGFAITGDLASYRGRKSKCRSCGSPFRIAEDGLSLERIDSNALPTPSGAVLIPVADGPPAPAPRVAGTMKLDAMPTTPPGRVNATMKLDAMPAPPARANATMKMDAMPPANPARANATMKMDAIPPVKPARASSTMKMDAIPPVARPDEFSGLRVDEAAPRSYLPWVVGGGLTVAVLAILGIVLIAMTSGEKSETEVAVAPVPILASTKPLKPRIPPMPRPSTVPPLPIRAPVSQAPDSRPFEATPQPSMPPPPQTSPFLTPNPAPEPPPVRPDPRDPCRRRPARRAPSQARRDSRSVE